MAEQKAPDFDRLLDMKGEDIKPPSNMPAGSYRAHTISREFIRSGKKGTPGVRFIHRFVEAGPDVDAGALEQALNGKQINEKEIRNDLWLTDGSLFMIKDLAEKSGINTSGRSAREFIESIPGSNVGINVIHAPSGKEGDDRTFANVGSYFTLTT